MLDKLDLELMEALQKDGRQSNVELARKLGMAESTIRKRIKELLDKDVIKIVAMPNPYKLGYGFVSIMGLQVRMADLAQVGEMLSQKPNIYYLSFVTGRYDLVAIVVSRTPEELSSFIKEHISAIPSITRTETFVNLEIIKSPWRTALDVVKLLATSSGKD